METKDFLARAGDIIPAIEKGAFLTVQAAGMCNTMTIGWGLVGLCWRKPVLMVAVRNSRHTFKIMEAAADFTVSMPSGNLRDEIFYCGTKSGRDVNKFEECELKTAAGRKIESPIIDTPGLHVECTMVYKNAMQPDNLASQFHGLYPEKDYHTLYFGEIVDCYEVK
jgi:flavin reductase (DIM6/NTAB) family NADH-FMN oxidoreductase RutF